MKLLAIDFANLIVRHHANPYGKAADLAGRPVNGAVGACAQVARLVREERPTHLLIAQDGPLADSVRRRVDPSYKQHRPQPDTDLRYQFEKAYEAVDVLRWPRLAHRGYEADDVIASAVRAFPGQVLIVSGDKDLLALCGPDVHVLLLRPGGAKRCGPEECRDLFGVGPELVRDYKALVGDPSDGIRGITGVGPKSARALLEAHGSLEGVLRAAEEDRLAVGAALAAKVKAGIAEARTAYALAALHDELAVDVASLVCPGIPGYDEMAETLRSRGLGDLAPSLPGAPRKRSKPARDISAVFDRVVAEMSEQAKE